MAITREQIITCLAESLKQDDQVRAAWLEGADSTGSVDEFSDIDFCCAADPAGVAGAASLAQAALGALGTLDLVHVLTEQAHMRHVTFHLADTSPYLLIDFCTFQAGRGGQFIEGDEIERPLILWDRGGVIKFHPALPALDKQNRPARLQELKDTVAQVSRLDKYLKRGDYLEAFGYYHKWLLQPLIEVLRMRYSPLHPDYYIVHISRHLPADVLARLEDLFKVSSIAEMAQKREQAVQMFDETQQLLAGVEH